MNKLDPNNFGPNEQEMNFTTAYGYNKIWRKYLELPDNIPLMCNYSHCVSIIGDPIIMDDIANERGLFLATNKAQAKLWRSVVKSPAIVAGTPFVHYRKMNNIEINPDAKGTIFFPAHSTYVAIQEYDIDELCNLLNNLPEKYHPITINLHSSDIVLSKIYEEKGFNVTTAGNTFDPDFPRNFYNNLKRHRYSASNQVGSHLFYCIEIGIPHFLIGKSSLTYVKNGCVDVPPGYYDQSKMKFYKTLNDLLPIEPTDFISDDFKKYVDIVMGVNDQLSPKEIKKHIIRNYQRYRFINKINTIYFINKSIKFIERNTRTPKKIINKIIGERPEVPYGKIGKDFTVEERKKFWDTYYGDKTVRLDYNLDEHSIIFDVGSDKGNWAEDIFQKYNSRMYIFENEKELSLINKKFKNKNKNKIIINSLEEFLKNPDSYCKIEAIDLMKIDIEGKEYELLEYLVESKLIQTIKNIQIQFHNSPENAYLKMQTIQNKLLLTHKITFQCEFVWENWELKCSPKLGQFLRLLSGIHSNF